MKKIDIVIPCLNEEKVLKDSVTKLSSFLYEHMSRYDWNIQIVDNGSDDSTELIGRKLARENQRVSYIRLTERGRGLALKHAFSLSKADMMAYMDIDLSTELRALPILVSFIEFGYCEIALGSRLNTGSKVIGRSVKREIISRCYSALIQCLFLSSFRDPQCGFKVINRQVIEDVLPTIKDKKWFFDTELLLVAEKSGYKILEWPVTWVDDPDSRVKILSTVYNNINQIIRLKFGGLSQALAIVQKTQR